MWYHCIMYDGRNGKRKDRYVKADCLVDAMDISGSNNVAPCGELMSLVLDEGTAPVCKRITRRKRGNNRNN